MKITTFSAITLLSTTAINSVFITPALADPNGSYSSWIDSSVLAQDHRAYCDDIVAQNIATDKGKNYIASKSNRSSDASNSSQSSTSREQTRGGSSKGIFSGSSFNSNQKNTSAQQRSNRDRNNNSYSLTSVQEWDRSTITSEAAGSNCSTFVNSAAQRDINYEQQITNRMAIEAKEKVKLEEIETNAQATMFQTLMQGW